MFHKQCGVFRMHSRGVSEMTEMGFSLLYLEAHLLDPLNGYASNQYYSLQQFEL